MFSLSHCQDTCKKMIFDLNDRISQMQMSDIKITWS